MTILNIALLSSIFFLSQTGTSQARVEEDNGDRTIKAIRKVLIVPRGETSKYIEKSKELGVPSIADGIPPRYRGEVTEDMLPYVYEEIVYEEEQPRPKEITKALEKLGADIAEYYPVLDKSIEAGDIIRVSNEGGIVSASSTKYLIGKSSKPYDSKILGVISSDAAIILNSAGGTNPENNEIARPVALVGRVPVKVSLENGTIEKGDYLTSSLIPGVAMKATRSGQTIGIALESLQEVDPALGYGKVMVFMNVGWHEEEDAAAFGGGILAITGPVSELFDLVLAELRSIGVFIGQNAIKARRMIASVLIIEKGPVAEENTIGEGVILSGKTQANIYNNNVTPTSKIFITFRGDCRCTWWAEEVGEGYFTIAVSEISLRDIPFDYWIVGVEEITPPSLEATEGQGNNQETITNETPSSNEQNTTTTDSDESGTTTPGIIYPEISADYDDYLENIASSTTTENGGISATTTSSL